MAMIQRTVASEVSPDVERTSMGTTAVASHASPVFSNGAFTTNASSLDSPTVDTPSHPSHSSLTHSSLAHSSSSSSSSSSSDADADADADDADDDEGGEHDHDDDGGGDGHDYHLEDPKNALFWTRVVENNIRCNAIDPARAPVDLKVDARTKAQRRRAFLLLPVKEQRRRHLERFRRRREMFRALRLLVKRTPKLREEGVPAMVDVCWSEDEEEGDRVREARERRMGGSWGDGWVGWDAEPTRRVSPPMSPRTGPES